MKVFFRYVYNLRYVFFLLPLIGFLSFVGSTDAVEEMGPPNIILIVADDLGLHDLGCYGNTVIETPRIDALAMQGIKFTRAYAASPICSPSRAAIQTGLHPARMALTEHIHGFPPPDPCDPLIPPNSLQRLPFAYTTIAEALKINDYKTIYSGKWHLGGFNHIPTGHGYDVSFAAGPNGLPNSFFPPYFNNTNTYPELYTTAGQDTFLTDALTTLAISEIPPDDTPFFINLNYYAPHVPIMGPADLVEKYEAIIGEDSTALPRPHYAAMVERIDQQVGRLVDTLVSRGLMENTILIFTSDHGALTVQEAEGFDEHTPPTTSGPLRGGKGYVFEGGTRVPLIVYSPEIYAPAIDDYPNMNTDYFSTITQLAEVPQSSLDGLPIPSLTGAAAVERSLYWHYPDYSPQRGKPAGIVIKGDNKLIEWFSDVDSSYLFNLQTDLGEVMEISDNNLDLVNQLKQELADWRAFTGARMMKPNPNYDPTDCD